MKLFARKSPPRALKAYINNHRGLKKAESSVLTQARTGKIGLNAFLFQRRIPGIPTPLCGFGEGPETVRYLLIRCWETKEEREGLYRASGPCRDLLGPIITGKKVRPILWWLQRRLPEYRVAQKYTTTTATTRA